MQSFLSFHLRYFLFWLIFSFSGRFIFILYHFKGFQEVVPLNLISVFVHGLPLDLSIAGYLSILPFLITSVSYTKFEKIIINSIKIYSYIIIVLLSLLVVTDAEIFRAWGARTNGQMIGYLLHFKEVYASSLSSPLLLLFIIWILYSAVAMYILNFFVIHHRQLKTPSITKNLCKVAVSFFLIIPMRGGFQRIPINESDTYFSSVNLINQGSWNVGWAFFHSILETNLKEDLYHFYEKEKADTLFSSLYNNKCATVKVLNTSRPNIIIIIWESFTSKTLTAVKGKHTIPNFQNLIKEGVFFSNIYASGDRSEKGLIALLSGYPSQPVFSIINTPLKSKKLPSLHTDLKKSGYYNSFYYGGAPEFANIKSYLLDHSLDNLISMEDFKKEQCNSKWGAHDEYVFNKVLEDHREINKPFFSTLFTLSSHEPFEIPIAPLYPANCLDNLFLNAHHYTDSCLGDFIRKAKKERWWKNTLVIIVADHGHPLPGGKFAKKKASEFKIPMLWLGGALGIKDTVIEQTGSQTDLAKTLLHQLSLSASNYHYSKDLFCNESLSFAYYCFNNGFGFVNNNNSVIYQSNIKKFKKYSKVQDSLVSLGKAYLQHSYYDFYHK